MTTLPIGPAAVESRRISAFRPAVKSRSAATPESTPTRFCTVTVCWGSAVGRSAGFVDRVLTRVWPTMFAYQFVTRLEAAPHAVDPPSS